MQPDTLLHRLAEVNAVVAYHQPKIGGYLTEINLIRRVVPQTVDPDTNISEKLSSRLHLNFSAAFCRNRRADRTLFSTTLFFDLVSQTDIPVQAIYVLME